MLWEHQVAGSNPVAPTIQYNNNMVDNALPFEAKDDRPLRYLFLDLNSYFASVEQQERPELRGKPIAVVPLIADTTVAIAASYEAKAFGVKTGTKIADAKVMCPDLILVDGRHSLYAAYHKRVLEAVESVLPIDKVCSIDEMRVRLLRSESHPDTAVEFAKKVKQAISDQIGPYLKCSIGIAPNGFLAKIATEMQKPDGLVVLEAKDLPKKLFTLKLTDFTGINKRMQARLNAAGIFTSEDLCTAGKQKLHSAFGSIMGERWYYLLRGYELKEEQTHRKSLSHSHVLPPELRTDQGCREVLLRLLQKASARLRAGDLWSGAMDVHVRGKKSWHSHMRIPPSQDTVTFNEHFLKVWESRDFARPTQVGVVFKDLHPSEEVTESLFDQTQTRAKLNTAVDKVNRRYGKNKIYLAGMEKAKDTAGEKIAFNKTELFSEGADDNVWIDTFTGQEIKDP
jgi:DNA polymerase IV